MRDRQWPSIKSRCVHPLDTPSTWGIQDLTWAKCVKYGVMLKASNLRFKVWDLELPRAAEHSCS